jgi:hypothetical protein
VIAERSRLPPVSLRGAKRRSNPAAREARQNNARRTLSLDDFLARLPARSWIASLRSQ